ASEIANRRDEVFAAFSGSKAAWTVELERAEGTQGFLNAHQNYEILSGTQSNLYKCFMVVGWRIVHAHGVTALLHPEGPFDDPKGGNLRQEIYPRLCSHFQFQNEFKLFPIGHRRRYGVNIYGRKTALTSFDLIANLFAPSTIDACYEHDGPDQCGGIKDNNE